MELYFAVITGAVIYGLIDFLGDDGKGIFSKRYLLTTLANILAGAALVWYIDLDTAEITFKGFDFAKMIAATFGVFGQKLFKLAVKATDKKIKTTIGLNK